MLSVPGDSSIMVEEVWVFKVGTHGHILSYQEAEDDRGSLSVPSPL